MSSQGPDRECLADAEDSAYGSSGTAFGTEIKVKDSLHLHVGVIGGRFSQDSGRTPHLSHQKVSAVKCDGTRKLQYLGVGVLRTAPSNTKTACSIDIVG